MDIQIIEPSVARNGLLMSRAYSHPLRIKMLEKLREHGSMVVNEFYERPDCIEAFGDLLEQSVVSQHLAILRKAILVETTREGMYIRYKVSKEIGYITNKLAELANFYESTTAAAN